jgi:hypothetical protein
MIHQARIIDAKTHQRKNAEVHPALVVFIKDLQGYLLLSGFLYSIGVTLDEIAHGSNNDITQGDIGLISNGLKYIFFVGGNPNSHNPVAFFGHRGECR